MDWLRRAADLMDIRRAGAAAFHLRAAFHAYQGIDFSPPGQSTMIIGNGLYEEWWASPEKWRREVTLGSYHAVEVTDGGVRKFQASADYEPSRVLMLLRALHQPIATHILQPRPGQKQAKWKLEQMPDDLLQRTRISDSGDRNGWGLAFQFLPDGTLVRVEDGFTGVVTTWRNQAEFAGKQVPQHIAIGGQGLGREMLSADVQIEPLSKVDEARFQLLGLAGDAGTTLRPIDGGEVKDLKPVHMEIVGSTTTSVELPVGVRVIATGVVDRKGFMREVEVSGIQDFGQPLKRDDVASAQSAAQLLVQAMQKDRYHPADMDGQPCELVVANSMMRSQEGVFSSVR